MPVTRLCTISYQIFPKRLSNRLQRALLQLGLLARPRAADNDVVVLVAGEASVSPLSRPDEGHVISVLPTSNFCPGTLAALNSCSPRSMFVVCLDAGGGSDVVCLQSLATGLFLRVLPPSGVDAARCDAAGDAADPACRLLLTRASNCDGSKKPRYVVESACAAAGRRCFIRVGPAPMRLVGATLDACAATRIELRPVPHPPRSVTAAAREEAPAAAERPWCSQHCSQHALSPEQRAFFETQGFLVVRGIVPPARVDAALRQAIAHEAALGDPACATAEHACRYGSRHPDLVSVFADTPLRCCAASLLRMPGGIAPVAGCQLAPRPPLLCGDATASAAAAAAHPLPSKWHVDGQRDATRDVFGFSLLMCVALTDTLRPCGRDGQLVVYPRSHAVIARHVAAHGVPAFCSDGDGDGSGEGSVPLPPLPEAAVELRLAAGDAVLLHPLTAHAKGVNLSTVTRRAAFYMVQHVRHAETRVQVLATGDYMAQFKDDANLIKRAQPLML